MSTPRPFDMAVEAIAVFSRGVEVTSADRWLVEFERTHEAWSVADELASDTSANAEIRNFWGAKFLYSKIQRDFHQLNAASIPSLATSLVQHILRLAQGNSAPMTVLRYLCLALAALTIQINADGTIKQILQWLDPILASHPRVILELLMSLAEESANRHIDVHPEKRESFCQQLTQTSGEVFGFLNYLATTTAGTHANNELKGMILRCVERWIDNTFLPGQFLATNPLYSWSLDCLSNADLFVKAVDVIRACLDKFRLTEEVILRTLLPRILSLKNVWIAEMAKLKDDAEDEDAINTCRVISRLLYETAWNFSGMFLVESEDPQSFELLSFLLECAKFDRYSLDIYYSLDTTIYPLRLAENLCCTLKRVSVEDPQVILEEEEEEGEEAEIYNLGFFRHTPGIRVICGNGAIAKYAPFFHTLLEIIMQVCIIPDQKLLNGERLFPDDFSDARDMWLRGVENCVNILGAEECVKVLCTHLSTIMSSSGAGGAIDWARVEGVLFCLQVATCWLPPNDTTYMPQIMAFLPHLPNIHALKTTSIHLIGSVSDWLVENPQYMGAIFTQLGGDLSNKSSVMPAAQTLNKLLKKCCIRGVTQSLPLVEVHTLTLNLRQSGNLPIKADEFILEGLSALIYNMNPQEHRAALQALIEPVINSLIQKLQSSTYPPPPTYMQDLYNDIDRCTVILRNAEIFSRGDRVVAKRDPEAITSIFVSIQPILQNVVEKHPIDPIAERVCRCYKHSIRACGEQHFLPYVPQFLTHLLDMLTKQPFSAFIMAIDVCLRMYSSAPSAGPTLSQTVARLNEQFFSRFNSYEQFEQNPDMVEEFFFYAGNVMECASAGFNFLFPDESSGISTTSLPASLMSLIQGAICGLQLQHNRARDGVIHFFYELLSFISKCKQKAQQHTLSPNMTSAYRLASEMITIAGFPLVQAIVSGLAMAGPVKLDSRRRITAAKLVLLARDSSPSTFQDWLVRSFAILSSWAQDEARVMNLIHIITNHTSGNRDLDYLLDQFAFKCRSSIKHV